MRYSGRRVVLSLYRGHEGKKSLQGTLVGLEDGFIHLTDMSGLLVKLPREQVAKARLEHTP